MVTHGGAARCIANSVHALDDSECCIVVLWFGADEYEEMSGDYTIRDGVIRDGDGDQISSRALQPVENEDAKDRKENEGDDGLDSLSRKELRGKIDEINQSLRECDYESWELVKTHGATEVLIERLRWIDKHGMSKGVDPY